MFIHKPQMPYKLFKNRVTKKQGKDTNPYAVFGAIAISVVVLWLMWRCRKRGKTRAETPVAIAVHHPDQPQTAMQMQPIQQYTTSQSPLYIGSTITENARVPVSEISVPPPAYEGINKIV